VSGAEWQPTAEDAALILKLIGDATDTEVLWVKGGPAPRLEVTALEVEGETLHSGDTGTLVVRIANSGPGIAYRVVASTRSSLEALHGHRLSFGSIKPGAEKTRTLKLTTQYQEKVANLRTALSDRLLTQAEFDRYDAELVACL
jgi:hypothetical protein